MGRPLFHIIMRIKNSLWNVPVIRINQLSHILQQDLFPVLFVKLPIQMGKET